MGLGRVIYQKGKQKQSELSKSNCLTVWHLTLSLITDLITVMQRAQYQPNAAKEKVIETTEKNKQEKQGVITFSPHKTCFQFWTEFLF